MLKAEKILAAMRSAGHGMTVPDLVARTGLTPQQVQTGICHNRELFRVTDWVFVKGHRWRMRVYGPADGQPDVPRPGRLPPAQARARTKQWRAERAEQNVLWRGLFR